MRRLLCSRSNSAVSFAAREKLEDSRPRSTLALPGFRAIAVAGRPVFSRATNSRHSSTRPRSVLLFEWSAQFSGTQAPISRPLLVSSRPATGKQNWKSNIAWTGSRAAMVKKPNDTKSEIGQYREMRRPPCSRSNSAVLMSYSGVR